MTLQPSGWPEGTGPVTIWRDGQQKAGPMGRNDAFAWLLTHQGQSVDWALRYEGWEVRATEPPIAGEWPVNNPWQPAPS